MDSRTFKEPKSLFFLLFILLLSLPGKGQEVSLLYTLKRDYHKWSYAEEFLYTARKRGGYEVLECYHLTKKKVSIDSIEGKIHSSDFGKVSNKVLFSLWNGSEEESDGGIYAFDSTGIVKILDAAAGEFSFISGPDYSVIVTDDGAYITDGTKEGTQQILATNEPGLSVGKYLATNKCIYFTKGGKMYKTNGTKEGTVKIYEFSEPLDENAHFFTSVEGELHFLYHLDNPDRFAGFEKYIRIIKVLPNDSTKTIFEYEDWDNHMISHKERFAKIGQNLISFGYYDYGSTQSQFVGVMKEHGPYPTYPFFDEYLFYGAHGHVLGNYRGKIALVEGLFLNKIHITDGTKGGTSAILGRYLYSLRAKIFHNFIYFSGEDPSNSTFITELWQYNGQSLSMINDLVPRNHDKNEYYEDFHSWKNNLYFSGKPEDDNFINLYKLSHQSGFITIGAFADYNNNGVKDKEEHFLPNQHYVVKENDRHLYTQQDLSTVNLKKGEYTYNLIPPKGWKLPADFKPVKIRIPEDYANAYHFPLIPDSSYTKITAQLAPTPTRCGFETDFVLHYQNQGMSVASGEIVLQPDSTFEFISATPSPTSEENGLLKWEIHELYPQNSGKITISFQMPGFENMGNMLSTSIFTNFKDLNGTQSFQDTSRFEQALTCSYDPNDIQVNPVGVGDQHLVLKNQELEYLIRFQNTGTDTAFNIVVRDTLGSDFDLESIRVVGSSHKMFSTLEENVLSFHFEDIQLPDSTRDEPGSHGYILYTIKPKEDRADSTIIKNQAAIFFDFNPPILTNTVFNTLVDKLPPPPKDKVSPPEKDLPQGITLMTYDDLNNNNKKEGNENYLPYQQYQVVPENKEIYTVEDSTFIPMGPGSYTISLITPKGWRLTSPHERQSVSIAENEHKVVSFGLTPDSTFTVLEANIASEPVNCNGQIRYYIYYKNSGTMEAYGKVGFIPDPKMAFMDANPEVKTSETGGMEWSIERLPPGQTRKISVDFQMATDQTMGDTLSSFLIAEYIDPYGHFEIHRDTTHFEQVLNCLQPQNSMQVNPVGIGEQHLSLKDQEFQYQINFHKPDSDLKGGAKVKIKIGGQVDQESLNIIGCSHPMYASLGEGNLIFHISETDQDESSRNYYSGEGHILYGISPEKGVTDSITLHNKAEIIFNTNAPVETNEVFNTLIEKFPVADKPDTDKEITSLNYTHQEEGLKVYPNPAREQLSIEWKNSSQRQRTYQLSNSLGQKVASLKSSEALIQFNISSLPEGLYFLFISGSKVKFTTKVLLE